MHRILKDIILNTLDEVKKRKIKSSSDSLTIQRHTSFRKSILNPKMGDIGLIAEIKLASPTEGQLGIEADLLNRLQAYQTSGADALSIITERKFFKGNLDLVATVKRSVQNLPVLQKDFIIDEFQIEESSKLGADALLLIARIISNEQLKKCVNRCQKLGLEPVVEIHNLDDLAKAVKTKTDIIAVNARNLDTFYVDVDRACILLKNIPDQFIKLGFSAVHSRLDVEKYKKSGAKAVLVGSELMKTKNIKKFIREIKNVN